MKIIVLEHPRMPSEIHFNDIAHTPLWSCLMSGYAAAAFGHAGHDVIYLDAPSEGWDFTRTQKEIIDWNPQMLCIHGIYFWENTPRLFEMLSQLKAGGFKGHICFLDFFPPWHGRFCFKTVLILIRLSLGNRNTPFVNWPMRWKSKGI